MGSTFRLSVDSNPSVLSFASYATSESRGSTVAASETASAKFTVTSGTIGAARSTGTLAGRLLAFGIAALREIESIVVHGRLLVLRSHFPHDNNADTEVLTPVYNDILELTRRDCYSSRISKQAMRVLLIQIRLNQTSHLEKSISTWPSIEISLFLREIMLCMPSEWTNLNQSRNEGHRELQTNFLFRPFDGNGRFNSLLVFLAHVILLHEGGCQAFIDAQCLDMVFHAYLNGCPEFVDNVLTSVWKDASKSLSQHPETLGHPLLTLFPQEVASPLEDLIRCRCRSRRSVWRQLDRECAVTRLQSWRYERYTLFGLRDVTIPTTVMFDIILDLLEFLQYDTYGTEVAQNALDILLYHLNHTHGWPFGSRGDPENTESLFTICDTYEEILDGLWDIVVHIPSISIQREFPLWSAIEYPYHLKPSVADSTSLETTENSVSRSHDAEVVATLLAIPLAIVREDTSNRSSY